MKSAAYSVLFALCTFLSACTTMQTGSAFQAGRRALIAGDDEAALGFFQTVAESNPNFVFTTGSSPRQSIWSFVGRAQYLTDQFPQARQSLERAISGDREENIARLYLGLTLIQEGDRQRGLKEIESGMRGIDSFLDNINRTQDLVLDSSGIRIETFAAPFNITWRRSPAKVSTGHNSLRVPNG